LHLVSRAIKHTLRLKSCISGSSQLRIFDDDQITMSFLGVWSQSVLPSKPIRYGRLLELGSTRHNYPHSSKPAEAAAIYLTAHLSSLERTPVIQHRLANIAAPRRLCLGRRLRFEDSLRYSLVPAHLVSLRAHIESILCSTFQEGPRYSPGRCSDTEACWSRLTNATFLSSATPMVCLFMGTGICHS
jgi:hypothetical protein